MNCRFGYPFDPAEAAAVVKAVGTTYPRVFAARNDPRLNNYNRSVVLGWLANVDIIPRTGSMAVLNYIGKHCTNAEQSSEMYKGAIDHLLPQVEICKPLLSLVTRTMNKLIGERDWSAQEVCHLLLNLPLQVSSRSVQNVDCRPEGEQSLAIVLPEDDGDRNVVATHGRSTLEKYKARPDALTAVTYLKFLRLYDFKSRPSSWKERPRAAARISNYSPRYDCKSQLEDYVRVKLMMHHPFTEVAQLKHIDGIVFGNYKDAMMYFLQTRVNLDPDYLDDLPDNPGDREYQDFGLEDDPGMENTWQMLAQQTDVESNLTLDKADQLGSRDIDETYDWSPHVGRYPNIADDHWELVKEANPTDLLIGSDLEGTRESLDARQADLYDLVISHYARRLAGHWPKQLVINLDGEGGTGKTHVMKVLSRDLQSMAEQNHKPNPVLRCAPTGAAARLISGRTLHQLFHLPIRLGDYDKLNHQNLSALQSTLRDIQYLIIDEKSMVGLKLLSWVDRRCKQSFPRHSGRPFGGLNIVLAGDFWQLPPVVGTAPYNDKALKDALEISGRLVYRAFNKTIRLDVIRRQEDQSLQDIAFRRALTNLRTGTVTLQDWQLLSTRTQTVVHTEIPDFATALRIYAKRETVVEYNGKRLRELGRPICNVMASHEGFRASEASPQDAGNSTKVIPLSIESRVMLTENIWTENGLVNGKLGTVCDIIWKEGSDCRKDPPFAVLVSFDDYVGPTMTTDDGHEVVPVMRSRQEFFRGAASCLRIQFPLTNAFCYHRSQVAGNDCAKSSLEYIRKGFHIWYNICRNFSPQIPRRHPIRTAIRL